MSENKTLIHGVRFTPAELAMLRDVADDRGCTVGGLIRWAVRKAVIADPPGSIGVKNEGSAVRLDNRGATPLVQP